MIPCLLLTFIRASDRWFASDHASVGSWGYLNLRKSRKRSINPHPHPKCGYSLYVKMRGPEYRGRTARTFSSRGMVKVNRPVFVRIPRMTKESGHFACKADHVVFTEYSPLYARLRVTACNNHEAERLVSARLEETGLPYDVYRGSVFFPS